MLVMPNSCTNTNGKTGRALKKKKKKSKFFCIFIIYKRLIRIFLIWIILSYCQYNYLSIDNTLTNDSMNEI